MSFHGWDEKKNSFYLNNDLRDQLAEYLVKQIPRNSCSSYGFLLEVGAGDLWLIISIRKSIIFKLYKQCYKPPRENQINIFFSTGHLEPQRERELLWLLEAVWGRGRWLSTRRQDQSRCLVNKIGKRSKKNFRNTEYRNTHIKKKRGFELCTYAILTALKAR